MSNESELTPAIRLLEAVIFASGEPVTLELLTRQLGEGADVPELQAELKQHYAARGVFPILDVIFALVEHEVLDQRLAIDAHALFARPPDRLVNGSQVRANQGAYSLQRLTAAVINSQLFVSPRENGV